MEAGEGFDSDQFRLDYEAKYSEMHGKACKNGGTPQDPSDWHVKADAAAKVYAKKNAVPANDLKQLRALIQEIIHDPLPGQKPKPQGLSNVFRKNLENYVSFFCMFLCD